MVQQIHFFKLIFWNTVSSFLMKLGIHVTPSITQYLTYNKPTSTDASRIYTYKYKHTTPQTW